MSNNTVSRYFPTTSENDPPPGFQRRTYSQITKTQAMEHHRQRLEQHIQSRVFGKVLQNSSSRVDAATKYSKPNPNERLWNPSPGKRPRHQMTDSKWRNEGDEHEKENSAPKYFKHDQTNIIPYNANDTKIASSLQPKTDLNNSFTEKISNLEIGVTLTPTNSPPPPTPTPLLNPTVKDNEKWIESLDPDYPYITEILNYWHTLEMTHGISPNYMEKQKEVSHKMRTILVDWLVEVTEEYRISDATLHRAVLFVDRFLSKMQISRSNLQLLGITCMFVACKIEEIQPPETTDLVYITDNTYEKHQLTQMECLILSVLDFDLLTPTSYEFTSYFSNTLQLNQTTQTFAHYTIDLSLLYGQKFLGYPGSVIAMAGCYVAIRCCGDNSATRTSVYDVVRRIKRLNANNEFMNNVEVVVGNLYYALLSANSVGDDAQVKSVIGKYSQFQHETYLVAAAAAAACSSVPWV